MIALSLLLLRFSHLRLLILSVWASMHMVTPDAPAIATSLAYAIASDVSPVFGSPDLEAAASAVYVARESGVRLRPVPWRDPRTGRPVDGAARGAYQIHGPEALADLDEQTRWYLFLLHAGAVACPESPMAPVVGSCRGAAKRMADHRVKEAKALLAAYDFSSGGRVIDGPHAAAVGAPEGAATNLESVGP
jgi:hypothetical protein